MAIIDRIRGKKADEQAPAAADKPKKAAAPKKASTKKATKVDESTEVSAPAAQANVVANYNASNFLKRPHVSEKAAVLMERGVYTFDVPVSAEKVSVRKAVEALYGVKVVGIRMVRHAGKPVFRGKRQTARNTWKKALVTLAKGQKIDLYQGV